MSAAPLSVLGGHLKLHPLGPRPTEDPLWLAASVPPLPEGSRILDAGCGIGTAGLAVLLRQPTLHLTSFDINPQLPPLAVLNAALNGLTLTPAVADVLTYKAKPFAAILCNPPFHAEERGHSAASPQRTQAHSMPAGGLIRWLMALHALTAPGGTLHLILHNAYMAELKAFAQSHQCHLTIAPIQSSNRPPKRILAFIRTNATPTCIVTNPLTTRGHLSAPLYLPLI